MKFSKPTTGSLILLDRRSTKKKDSIISATASVPESLPQLIPMAMTKANSFPSSASSSNSSLPMSSSDNNMNDEDLGDSFSSATDLISADDNGGDEECEDEEEEKMELDEDIEDMSENHQSSTPLAMEVSPARNPALTEDPPGSGGTDDNNTHTSNVEVNDEDKNQNLTPKSSEVKSDQLEFKLQYEKNNMNNDKSLKVITSLQNPELRYVPPLTSETLLNSCEALSDEKLNEYMIQCVTCDEQFRLFELFNHAMEVHSVYTCVMCLSHFKFSRELMVHLHRAHRIMSQVFETPHQFLAAGGSRTYLSCVECSKSFNLLSSTDTNSFISHQCAAVTNDPRYATLEDTPISSEGSYLSSSKKKFTPGPPNQILTRKKSFALKFGGSDNGERVTPPALKKESTILPAVRVQRKKLAAMPELNPMVALSPKKTNGWLENDQEEYDEISQCKSRPGVEVTVVSRRGGRGGRRGRGASRRSSLSSLSIVNKQGQFANSTDNSGFQIKEENSEIESDLIDSSVIMDPLLVEKDPVKRLNLLVEELSSRLSQHWPGPEMPGYTRTEPDDSEYDIKINYNVENKVDDEILAQMLSLTCLNCTYCRQVKLIKVDKRQLAVHLFSKHLWNLKFSSSDDDSNSSTKQCTQPIKSEDQIKTDPSADNVCEESRSPTKQVSSPISTPNLKQESSADSQLASKTQEISDPDSNIAEADVSSSNLLSSDSENQNGTHNGTESDLIDDTDLPKISDSSVQDEKKEQNQSTQEPADLHQTQHSDAEITPVTENPTERKNFEAEDSATAETLNDTKNSETGEHPATDNLNETKDSEDKESPAIVLAETKPTDASVVQNVEILDKDPKQNLTIQEFPNISWDEFKLAILRKVFQSNNVVFSYDNGYEFGEAPCECLLCGYSVESQKNLFPHWRKIHRGVAMRCAMCQGRFLFAGALFSHLCLGTPNPLVKSEITNGPPTTGGKHTPSQSGSLGKGVAGGDLQMSEVNTEDGSADTIVLRYQCNICRNLQLPGFFNYMVHMRQDHIRCELCLEHMESQRDLEHHMKKHKLNHFCWKCGVTYCAKPNFMTHLFWKHGSESKECSICLKKKWPFIYHFCVPPTHFVCDVCEFYFTKPKCLMVHKRLHTGEKKHKCTVRKCDQRFISKNLLKWHVESDHTTSQPLALAQTSDNLLKVEDSQENEIKPLVSEDAMDSFDADTEEMKPIVAETPLNTVEFLPSPSMETSSPKDYKPSLKLVIKTVPTAPDRRIDEPEMKSEQVSCVEENNEQPDAETQKCSTVYQEPTITQSDENLMEVDEDGEKKPFDLQEIQGPNLSEDESDGETEGGVHRSKSGGSRRKNSMRRLLMAAAKSPSSEITEIPESNDKVCSAEKSPIQKDFVKNVDVDMDVVSTSNLEDVHEDPLPDQSFSELPWDSPVSTRYVDGIKSDTCPIELSPKELMPSEADDEVSVPVEAEKLTAVIESSEGDMKQVANDLVLSEDSTSSDSDDDGSKEDSESDSDNEDPKQKEEGKIAVTDLLDQCENLEKNLNQSAMDVEDPFKKVAALGLDLNPTDLLEDPEKIKPQDDFGSMSPLLPPLDDFNFNVPDIPTFEDNTLPDHIIRENAIFSVYNEHDYCLRQDSKRIQAPNHNRHSPVQSSHSRGHSVSPKKKKKKKSLKQKKKAAKHEHSRKRHHSSSSSSSSSSSCSSCGSNCSCSSSSSSSSSSSEDSSSDNEDQEKMMKSSNVGNVPYATYLPLPSPNNSVPVKRGRGRPKGSINRNKDGMPTAKKWAKIKLSHVHRSHSEAHNTASSQHTVSSQQSVVSDGGKPKRKYRKKKGLYTRKISNHPEKENSKAEEEQPEFPEENFILETDLTTDDSGSEEVYNQKQMNEVIGKRSALDEIWTMSNEQYLLLMVKGVKELKDLEPPPFPNIQQLQQQQRNQKKMSNSTYYMEPDPTYSVQRPTVPVPRLKVRNVPIKPLIVRRNPSVKSSADFEYSRKPDLKGYPNHSTFESFPPCVEVNGNNEPKIKLHISKKPNSMGSYSKSFITSRPAPQVCNHPQLGDRIPFVKLEDVSSKALEHGIVLNQPPIPAITVRRPKIKIGTGKGGRKSNTTVNMARAAPAMHVEVEKPLDSSLANNINQSVNIKEEVYCYCRCPHDNVSQMIGCDADDCEFQWFHFECVGVTIPPKGKWFCPDCKSKRKNKSADQRKDRVKEEGWNHIS